MICKDFSQCLTQHFFQCRIFFVWSERLEASIWSEIQLATTDGSHSPDGQERTERERKLHGIRGESTGVAWGEKKCLASQLPAVLDNLKGGGGAWMFECKGMLKETILPLDSEVRSRPQKACSYSAALKVYGEEMSYVETMWEDWFLNSGHSMTFRPNPISPLSPFPLFSVFTCRGRLSLFLLGWRDRAKCSGFIALQTEIFQTHTSNLGVPRMPCKSPASWARDPQMYFIH